MRLLYPDRLYVSVQFLEPDEVRRRYDAVAMFIDNPLRFDVSGENMRLKTRKLGTVVFGKDNFGGGIVAHELLHATFKWAKAVQLWDKGEDHETEERICEQLGFTVMQFWNAYYEQKEINAV